MASRKEYIQSEILVLQYQGGEDSALAKIVSMWERPLLFYIRRLVNSEEDAWDVLQEVWIKVVRGVGALRTPRAFPAWLYTIARNAAKNHLRDSPSAEELGEDHLERDSADGFDDASVAGLDAEAIYAALGTLSLAHRDVLTLHFLEGFSLAEIAAITSLSLGTLKSRLHYAKKALRHVLEGYRHE